MTNSNIQHPLENGQQVVMVRSTASGFEQGIAALVGLCTAGPLGAIASWGALRGLQGKWMPWALLGIPAAPILVGVQLAAGAALMAPLVVPMIEEQTSPKPSSTAPQSRSYQPPSRVTPTTVPAVSTNYGSAPRNTCWFQMASGRTKGAQCSVSDRVNANGHTVIDLVEPNGTKRAIVLWKGGEAEVFLKGDRYVGTHTISGNHISVTVGGGTFQFLPPQG